jgi:hypothetical protein
MRREDAQGAWVLRVLMLRRLRRYSPLRVFLMRRFRFGGLWGGRDRPFDIGPTDGVPQPLPEIPDKFGAFS